MLIIISQDFEKMQQSITVALPTLDDNWMIINKELGNKPYELVTEKFFRYAEHWMYKIRFNPKYLIPNWRKLPNNLRDKIKILGNLLDSYYEMITWLYGNNIKVFDIDNNFICYQLVRDEFKINNYLLSDIPIKRNWIKEEKNKRGKLRKYENPIDRRMIYSHELISKSLEHGEKNHTFKVNILNKFITNYKLWCDSVSSDKDWYTKV